MIFPNLKNEKILSIDLETYDPNLIELGTGCRRDDSYILGVSIATKTNSWYFNLSHDNKDDRVDESKFWPWLKPLESKELIFANALYDLDHLQYQNFKPRGIIRDVLYAEPLLDENKKYYNLDSLGKEYFNMGKEKTAIDEFCQVNKLKGDSRKWLWKMPSHLVRKYAEQDARLTYDVHFKQLPLIEKEDLSQVYDLECGLIPLLLQMKKQGIRFNTKKRNKLDKDYLKRINENQEAINRIAGMEINTNAAASIAMAFDKMGFSYEHTDIGNPCFDEERLELYGNELSESIVENRHLGKAYNTYINGMEKFVVNGRIHPEFNQLRSDEYGTVTGRFSGSKPNLQNLPSKNGQIKKDTRGLFLPEEGHKWVKIDYCQEEMVIFAHYAMGPGAEKLRKMYINDPEADIYKIFASLALKKSVDEITDIERKKFKTISLGVLYGMGTDELGRSLKIISENKPEKSFIKKFWENIYQREEKMHGIPEKHKKYFTQYYSAWSVLHTMHKELPCLKETTKVAADIMQSRGYVKTILGRRRRINDFYYKAFNAIDQGSGGDVMKKAMLDCYDAGIFNVVIPLATVHDELDVSMPDTKEGKEAVKEMKNIMETCIKFKVPLRTEVEMGENWGNLKRVKI